MGLFTPAVLEGASPSIRVCGILATRADGTNATLLPFPGFSGGLTTAHFFCKLVVVWVIYGEVSASPNLIKSQLAQIRCRYTPHFGGAFPCIMRVCRSFNYWRAPVVKREVAGIESCRHIGQ